MNIQEAESPENSPSSGSEDCILQKTESFQYGDLTVEVSGRSLRIPSARISEPLSLKTPILQTSSQSSQSGRREYVQTTPDSIVDRHNFDQPLHREIMPMLFNRPDRHSTFPVLEEP